jgi:hypothetical protein
MSQWNGPGGGPPSSGHAPTCASCGAPDNGELVTCRFCQQAVSAEAARTAIPCPNPQCRALCRWGKQRCAQCQAWIVVSCVFCGAISPHNVSNCLQCHEAFAGAPQRKAQMDAQQQHQQNMQTAGVWGNVAASFLGAAAGAAVGSHSHSWSSYDTSSSYDDSPASSVDTFDIGDVSDDTDFDGGSSDDY